MNKANKILSFILATLFLCALFSACEKEPTLEVISEQCVPLFNEAIEHYKNADCRSGTRAAATLAKGEEKASYIQSFDSLLHNLEGERKIVSKYCVTTDDPEKVEESTLLPFYDCYVQKGVCYYDFEDDSADYKESFTAGYFSKIGLYAFSGRMPRSVYAAKDGDVILLSMSFSPEDCAEMERSFILTMTTALFKDAPQVEVSRLSIMAHLDAETHCFTDYNVIFTATVPENPEVTLTFTYTEEFSDYGTNEQISFPDLSAFPEQDLSQVK